MLKGEVIKLKSATVGMEKDKFVVRVKIINTQNRTLHAYASARRILYDNATGKLTLLLHDHSLSKASEDVLAPHMKQPEFIMLEGGVETELRVKLDPVISRIRSAAERGNGPMFEELRVSEAREVAIEIAFHDTPFYYNPKLSNLLQLKEWGKTITKANFSVKSRPEEETKATSKKEE